LKESGAGAIGSARGDRLRNGLVVVQLTLALSLLVVSGLTLRTTIALQRIDLGYDHRGLAVFRVDLPRSRYADDAAVRDFFTRLLERVSTIPGVRTAGAGNAVPGVEGARTVPLTVEGQPTRPDGPSAFAGLVVASPTFLETLGLPVVAGRAIDGRDTAGAEPTVVVNRALVARHFAGREPLGSRIRLGPPESPEPWRTIVGVVADTQNEDPSAAPLPQAYVPFLQRPERALAVFLRARSSGDVLAAARAELRRLDPEQPLYRASTMERLLFEELASNRVITGLFVAFAAVALGMGAVGLYGVIAYAVSRRTREIGVRMALGATQADVVRMVQWQGARLTALGLALGLGIGFALANAVAGVLYGVSPADPLTYATVCVALGLAAWLASWIPARRASRVDPLLAVRAE
ncbi:MAG TPA: FtsX-like permease family protein, partial [Vicinamibacteria bacterium]|nr:FtsX-like permease family protein [Vicinamibacteria bacterium]